MKGKKTQAEKDWVSEEDEDEKFNLNTDERFTSMKLKKIPTVKPKHIDKIMFEIEIAEMVKNIEGNEIVTFLEKFATKVQFEELEEGINFYYIVLINISSHFDIF